MLFVHPQINCAIMMNATTFDARAGTRAVFQVGSTLFTARSAYFVGVLWLADCRRPRVGCGQTDLPPTLFADPSEKLRDSSLVRTMM